MDFIDSPIIEAIDYFQGVLVYFFKFALAYGNFFGLLGIIWTSVKLINSRITMRDAWWSMLSKWFVFVLLLNFYVVGTNAIMSIANNIGTNAGEGKTTIVKNFVSLKSRIEKELEFQKQWEKGLKQLEDAEFEIEMNPLSTSKEIKAANKKVEAYKKTRPKEENTIYGQKTLNALNEVLIMRNTKGERSANITEAYVVDKPDVNMWLSKKSKDENGNEVANATSYLSGAAILRIFILSGQIIKEKARMEVVEEPNDDGEIKYKVQKRKGISITNLDFDYLNDCIMADVLAFCLIAAGVFCVIQYVMCVLEYIIVQGFGAAFVPLYLFDGTKEIPKKLVNVFTGFVIKIIVITICMMFVLNLNLKYAAQQISPSSGSMSLPVFAEGIFIILLSFVLTSNAPKIAMTLLTGQPQLSMGELMQVAATLGTGAMMAKNGAGTALSPLKALAQKKAHDWSERSGASTAARQKKNAELRDEWGKNNGYGSSKSEQKRLQMDWNKERCSGENRGEIKEKLNSAGHKASSEVKEMQKAEYKKHGGVAGSAGRFMAHYSGAILNPKQTLMQGRGYNMPQSNIDVNRAGRDSVDSDKNYISTVNPAEFDFNNKNTKPETKKNNLPDDPNVGTRQVE